MTNRRPYLLHDFPTFALSAGPVVPRIETAQRMHPAPMLYAILLTLDHATTLLVRRTLKPNYPSHKA